MINRICLNCKKDFKTYPSRIKIGKGKYCSNWNWKGGISKESKRERKKSVFERDNYTCIWCGQVRGDIVMEIKNEQFTQKNT